MMNAKSIGWSVAAVVAAAGSSVQYGWSEPAGKIMAQKVLEEVVASHHEITSLEIASARSGKETCRTIAATEAKEVGEKCDEDELTATKTNQPFVEQEKDEFDVTLPIHDSGGKIIGTAGMDFAVGPGRTKGTVTRQALQIGRELEKRFPSRDKLFEPVQ